MSEFDEKSSIKTSAKNGSDSDPVELEAAAPEVMKLTTMLELFAWYKKNLCQLEINDCRGFRVRFLETDFVHLIQLVDKYGNEPKNHRMTIEQIESERIKFVAGRFNPQRAKELSWARSIISAPWRIVPNWQVMGRANPGEAYIRNFGTLTRPIYRVLICGFAGQQRIPVTIFPRKRFSRREIDRPVWP